MRLFCRLLMRGMQQARKFLSLSLRLARAWYSKDSPSGRVSFWTVTPSTSKCSLSNYIFFCLIICTFCSNFSNLSSSLSSSLSQSLMIPKPVLLILACGCSLGYSDRLCAYSSMLSSLMIISRAPTGSLIESSFWEGGLAALALLLMLRLEILVKGFFRTNSGSFMRISLFLYLDSLMSSGTFRGDPPR